MRMKVGCCGFPIRQETYYKSFRIVELQSTFYRLPRQSTVERWREAAPHDFEFVVKAWQVITHPNSSPTWKRARLEIAKVKGHRYGYLRPTPENLEAFNRTLDVCEALRARICLIQCPPSFRSTQQNVRNLKRFLTDIERRGLTVAWEPRGDWIMKTHLIRKLCNQLGIVHVVDLLRRDPASIASLVYCRLHGLGDRELNYTYQYTGNDLQQLARKLSSIEKQGCQEAYVLFNNVTMFEDAKRFSRLVSRTYGDDNQH